MLRSLTNRVEVTLYYDTATAEFLPGRRGVAGRIPRANKNISVRTVDYTRNPGEAMKVKEKFDLPTSLASPNAPPTKDLMIFACGDRHDVIPGGDCRDEDLVDEHERPRL